MKRVEAITCPSQKLLDEMISRFSLEPEIRAVVPNPVAPAAPNAVWNYRNANPDQILCVGRIDLRKGADIVMRAFAKALERRPSLSLIMAGPDSGIKQEDGTTLHFEDFVSSQLTAAARSQIHFLGAQPPERLAELRLGSAIAVVGSRFENFAYSVSEAMATGMPVLVSDTFGNSELIRDGIDGRVVPVADVDAMADAMIAMLSDASRLTDMGRSGRSRADSWLSPERIARETVSVYRRAIALSKP